MLQRKVIDISYCCAALLTAYGAAGYFTWPKMAWSDQSGVRPGTAVALLLTCAPWHDEQLHGCILGLLLSSQPHAQQGTAPWAVDGSVSLKQPFFS